VIHTEDVERVRVANLLQEQTPVPTPKQMFEGVVGVIAAVGFIVIAWFAWSQR
jgi:hypothetical protein